VCRLIKEKIYERFIAQPPKTNDFQNSAVLAFRVKYSFEATDSELHNLLINRTTSHHFASPNGMNRHSQ